MKLNFDFEIKNLKGEPFPNSNAGEILSNFLAQLNKGNSLKLWDWAQKIYKKEELEIDRTDAEVLQGLIETSESLPNITKAQIIEVIKKEMLK